MHDRPLAGSSQEGLNEYKNITMKHTIDRNATSVSLQAQGAVILLYSSSWPLRTDSPVAADVLGTAEYGAAVHDVRRVLSLGELVPVHAGQRGETCLRAVHTSISVAVAEKYIYGMQ